jgi:hypothetical protein
MSIDWDEINKALIPIKGYEDLYKRLYKSLEYPILLTTFNVSISQLIEYTRLGLGGDPQGRYNESAEKLIHLFTDLQKARVENILDLMALVKTRQDLQAFSDRTCIPGLKIVSAVKYLIYWFIPIEKYLSGLVKTDPSISRSLEMLQSVEVKTNLDLLQRGYNKTGRKDLSEKSGLPLTQVEEWVNRADLSRMPWASKATIANIMGAGYGSLAQLANADPEKLYLDFYRYGKSIGKNLKLGNEIENSHRIAKILPVILQ